MSYMIEPKRQLPFKTLGQYLRALRERRQESLAEVAEAIEIESSVLEQIEEGAERPDEDTLMLFISYYGLQDNEAVQLWHSAGYTKDDEASYTNLREPQIKGTTILLAVDIRAIYSDSVAILGNQNGVIMNFMQNTGSDQPLTVSRVGMSYSQAEELLHSIERVLLFDKYLPKQRMLPSGDNR